MGIIIGLQSATKHAKELKPYSNMAISAALVIEIADTLEAKEKEIENLKAQVEQLRRPLIKLTEVNHEKGGSLQADGQFAYRVKESIFKEAKAALDKIPNQCLFERDLTSFKAGYDAAWYDYSGCGYSCEERANDYAKGGE